MTDIFMNKICDQIVELAAAASSDVPDACAAASSPWLQPAVPDAATRNAKRRSGRCSSSICSSGHGAGESARHQPNVAAAAP